jgi:hypothetical protein
VSADGLVELVTTPPGPRRANDNWSYPDFVDLRGSDTGIAMTGWTHRRETNHTSKFGRSTGGVRADDVDLRELLQDDRRGAGVGIRMILLDVVKLVMPGVAVGLIITVASVRLNSENVGIPLSDVEPLASLSALRSQYSSPSSPASPLHAAPRRVQPMVAMRSEQDF